MIFGISILGVVFLSTLSLRRATPAWLPYFPMEQRFLSTLSLRRATVHVYELVWGVSISIHALLAESDASGFLIGSRSQFLSTLSLRRATGLPVAGRIARRISIHALLAESDLQEQFLVQFALLFLSTLSLRRATI